MYSVIWEELGSLFETADIKPGVNLCEGERF